MNEQLIEEKYIKFSNELSDIKENFIGLNTKLINLLTEEEFQKNPELNETVHVQIYNIKKIIETFENILEKTEYLPYEKQVVFVSLFSEEFLKNITRLYSDALSELELIIQKNKTPI